MILAQTLPQFYEFASINASEFWWELWLRKSGNRELERVKLLIKAGSEGGKKPLIVIYCAKNLVAIFKLFFLRSLAAMQLEDDKRRPKHIDSHEWVCKTIIVAKKDICIFQNKKQFWWLVTEPFIFFSFIGSYLTWAEMLLKSVGFVWWVLVLALVATLAQIRRFQILDFLLFLDHSVHHQSWTVWT